MDHLLITIADEDIKDNKVVDAFERRLRRSLNDKTRFTGVLLRAEQRASSALLNWLELWTREFEAAGQGLIVIPVTREQFEALEISHPDQRLVYYSSVEEWNTAFPVTSETAPTPAPVLAEPPPVAVVTAPAAPEPAPPAPAVEKIFMEPLVDQPEIAIGVTVEISGEYACTGCGMLRTWLKGDVLEPCDNVECMNCGKGWKLSCDLF
ncbi:MAG: hypothetical protein JXA71_20295 [Chitinispirillaceae bacterium]|nr:hypothetical protein [Chitinispirillaceae bacterium]